MAGVGGGEGELLGVKAGQWLDGAVLRRHEHLAAVEATALALNVGLPARGVVQHVGGVDRAVTCGVGVGGRVRCPATGKPELVHAVVQPPFEDAQACQIADPDGCAGIGGGVVRVETDPFHHGAQVGFTAGEQAQPDAVCRVDQRDVHGPVGRALFSRAPAEPRVQADCGRVIGRNGVEPGVGGHGRRPQYERGIAGVGREFLKDQRCNGLDGDLDRGVAVVKVVGRCLGL